MMRVLRCVLFLLIISAVLSAQTQDEKAVKAAFVFSLTQYVEWPHKGQAITVGFIGEGPMGATLQRVLEGKISDNRSIHVLLSPSAGMLEKCDVVYLAHSSRAGTRSALEQFRGRNVLTIGDADWFAASGGMIGLVTTGDHVRLEINLHALQDAHLKLSSRVLKIATVVSDGEEARR